MTSLGPEALLGLLALGALHGVNPGMGWLFAVALGLQERNGRAVWRALPPLVLGHAAAIGLALTAAVLVGRMLSPELLRWAVAALLLGFGLQRLALGHGHTGLASLRVNRRQLAGWSFLMASGHGAGLMVVPLLLPGSGGAAPPSAHAAHGMAGMPHDMLQAGPGLAQPAAVLATLVHSAGYLAVTALLALLVYHRFGLRLLRTAWINLDAIWAAALVITGVLVLVT